jgi:hypothetical protein
MRLGPVLISRLRSEFPAECFFTCLNSGRCAIVRMLPIWGVAKDLGPQTWPVSGSTISASTCACIVAQVLRRSITLVPRTHPIHPSRVVILSLAPSIQLAARASCNALSVVISGHDIPLGPPTSPHLEVSQASITIQ